MSVAERIMNAGHCRIVIGIVEQVQNLGHNKVRVRPDKACRSGVYPLRTLSCIPHDKYRLTERRRFLLDPAGVCEYQCSQSTESRRSPRIPVELLFRLADAMLGGRQAHRARLDWGEVVILLLHPAFQESELERRQFELIPSPKFSRRCEVTRIMRRFFCRDNMSRR